MSYAVTIECGTCGHLGESFNPTYNLAPFFQWAMHNSNVRVDGLRGLNGEPTKFALLMVSYAIEKCEIHPDLSEFDLPNGWGTGAGALKFLQKFRRALMENPNATVRVA